MKEVIEDNFNKIKNLKNLKEHNLTKNSYFVVSSHRQENIENKKNFSKILSIIEGIEDQFGLPVIISTHPRTRKKLDSSKKKFSKNIKFLKPLSFSDYIKLQMESKLVLSDSGTINEEASILNFNAINLRESYERPESAEEGSTILTGLSMDRVFQAIKVFENMDTKKTRTIVKDYDTSNVSEKVANTVLSYTDYINRVVWKKY